MAYSCDDTCKFDHDINKKHLLHHIKNNISTKIDYSQIDLLPKRNDLMNKNLVRSFKHQIDRNKPVLFFPNDVVEKNEWCNLTKSLTYKVFIFGILPCGSKTCVVLDNIKVYVDVKIPDNANHSYVDYLCSQLRTEDVQVIDTKIVSQYQLHGFQKAPSDFVRIYFQTTQERRKALIYFEKLNRSLTLNKKPKMILVANDSTGVNNYYCKTAREYKFNTAGWNRIENYEVAPQGELSTCTYTLRVKIDDYKKLDKKRLATLLRNKTELSDAIKRDPLVVKQWDIETYREIQNGEIPRPSDTDFTIFMICSAYFYHHSNTPLMSACIVDRDINTRPGLGLIILCNTEENVLRAHMKVVGNMSPDISAAFNGGQFDWPLYREKLKRLDLLVELKQNFSSLPLITSGRYTDDNESVEKWCFREAKIKTAPGSTHELERANFPGMLDTDVMPTFMCLYPKAEVRKAASLNHFLQINGLDSKEDMPYKTMGKVYERARKLKNIRKCHCDTQTVGFQNDCETCTECVPRIDCVLDEAATELSGEPMFSDILHPDLVGADGRPKCCYCGKRERNLKDMTDVGFYCYIDCLRPQQLYTVRNIIADKRELSNMAYVTLYHSFYNADGMKVCNLIGAYCKKFNIGFDNGKVDKGDHEKDHYPGAWVFPPNRGLHSDNFMDVRVKTKEGAYKFIRVRARPTTGLDFASLYPSIMMALNLSPDMVVKDKARVEQLRAEGYTFHEIEPFEYDRGEKKNHAGNEQRTANGWVVRHNGIINPKTDTVCIDHYVKHVVLNYTKDNTEHVINYIASKGMTAEQQAALDAADGPPKRSVKYEAIYGRKALPGERLGIFSIIVKKLFDKRVPVKRAFLRLEKILEQMSLQNVEEWEVDGEMMSKDNIEFEKKCLESKQKALKVLANTFYGKSGDFRCPVYELLVAAGITCAGQKFIKLIEDFVISKGFLVHYGDTDSLYMACPDEYFAQCDAQYDADMAIIRAKYAGVAENPLPVTDEEKEFKRERVAARVIWWEEQVRITMEVMGNLQETVFDYLIEQNGTLFLRMAYEEVIMPSVYCGKKKYFGIGHIETINFYPKPDKLFIRGIEVIKQGQTGLSVKLGLAAMNEIVAPENERTIIDIIHDKIHEFYNMKHTAIDFMQKAKYKPHAKNVPVQTFVARMRRKYAEYKETDPLKAALYEPPEAGDKFDYVVVRRDQQFTLEGKRIELKKGDRMEYLRVFRSLEGTPNELKLDLDYMRKALVGLFARFIASNEMFQPAPDAFSIDQYTEMDKFCITAATKYLTNYCDNIIGYDRKAITQLGRDYRKIFGVANKMIRANTTAKLGSMGYIIHDLTVETESDNKTQFIIDQIHELTDNIVTNDISQSYIKFNDERGVLDIYRLRALYSSKRSMTNIKQTRLALCNRKEAVITDRLREIIPEVICIIRDYKCGFIELIENMRNGAGIVDADIDQFNTFNEYELDKVQKMYSMVLDLITIAKIRKDVIDLTTTIGNQIATQTNDHVEPEKNTREIIKEKLKRFPIVDDYVWA